MELTRETFGNIPILSKVVFYVLSAGTVGIFAYGIHRHIRLWKLGRKNGPKPDLWRLFIRLAREVFGQRRVRGRGLASQGHVLLFGGFMVLLLGTILLMVDHVTTPLSSSLHFHQGVYYAVYEITLDTAGLVFLAGCVLLAYRRWKRPPSLGHVRADWAMLFALFFTGITGFLVEGLRIYGDNPPLPGVAFAGFTVAQAIRWVGDEPAARTAYHLVWWIHAIPALTIVALFPYTRLFHSVAGILNIALEPVEPGVMTPVSLEEVEETGRVGIGAVEDFSRRELLQLDACMECGRCQEACPAFASEKPLTPRGVVQDLMRYVMTSGPSLAGAAKVGGESSTPPDVPELHGATIQADTLWSCTTCSACTHVCPVRIDPVGLVLGMRRFLVAEGRLRGSPATALRRMENSGNPWGLPAEERTDWTKGLDVPTVKDRPDFEILYWVGCAAAYDRRIRRVARSIVKLLKAAGVRFAILGEEERCTGESARRIGEEFVFQELARANIETLSRYNVQRILTHCPHCLNSLKRDYAQFGGHYEVVHHSQLLAELLRQGRLPICDWGAEGEGGKGTKRVTFHDPCYLARIQGMTEAPRRALGQALSASESFVEMERREANTFCCGAGGGRMWFDEDPSQRVSALRAREALKTGANTVGVSCPFCLIMMTDAVAQEDPNARVLDVAELLAGKLADDIEARNHPNDTADDRKDQEP